MSLTLGTATLIGGAIKGITGLGKMWYGNRQRKEGLARQKEAKGMWANRPEMGMPAGVEEMIAKYREMAGMQRLPGQDVTEGNIRSSTVQGMDKIKQMQSGAGGLGAIAQMVAGEQDRFSDLGVNLAEMVNQNQGRLAGALGQKADWQQKAWEWNKAQPWETQYQQTYGEGQATEGAGIQNLWSGATQLGNVASDTMIGMAGGGKGGDDDTEGIAELISQILKAYESGQIAVPK